MASLAQPSPDAALLAAYEDYRRINAAIYSLHVDDNEGHERLTAEMDAPDQVLFGARPTTIAGVNALLRRILPSFEAHRWLDRTLAYDDHETLEERKDELSGVSEKLVECVIALTRIAQQQGEA